MRFAAFSVSNIMVEAWSSLTSRFNSKEKMNDKYNYGLLFFQRYQAREQLSLSWAVPSPKGDASIYRQEITATL